MAQPLDQAMATIRAAIIDDATLVKAVASGRRQQGRPSWRRADLRYVDIKAGRRLQVTAYDERQAHTVNHTADETGRVVDELLAQPFGNWHVETTVETVQLRVTKRGDALVHRRPRDGADPVDHGHDRRKRRLLDPADPVLHVIGIADHQGRIKPSRQDKFRQVEEFLRSLQSVMEAGRTAGVLPTDRPLRVVDLGCGNAYLTFAAYAYLHDVLGLAVEMIGVDVSAPAHRRNTELAAQLGWDGLTFVEGTIATTEMPSPPDVVLSLHACDTATDEALARAIGWEAPLMLAAPCCHHDVQRQMQAVPAPHPYRLVARHGILSERLADVLTDALRATLLRQRGYRVDVIQFVESKHTPRNVLLRAVRTGAAVSSAVQGEYDELIAAWAIRPALARMLDQS
ncbi:MAG: SAM-dependent methyltransferase [Acidimicrobiia bacterium]|nr:SAM-dependent methyltransferase [Acidimicrobiia bacterium]